MQQMMDEFEIDEELQDCVLYGVLLQHRRDAGRVGFDQALKHLRLYLESAGRYGPDTGPFLTPLYGCGELPQAFSRAAAVSGAVQVLHCGIVALDFDEHKFACSGVELENGQTVRCSQLIGGLGGLKDWLVTFNPDRTERVALRCTAILAGPLSIVPHHLQQVLFSLPRAGYNGSTVWGMQLGKNTGVCPSGYWVLHLWADCGDESMGDVDATQALLPCLKTLCQCEELSSERVPGNDVPDEVLKTCSESASGPQALLAAFFSLRSTTIHYSTASWPKNVFLCPGPTADVTLDAAAEVAGSGYQQLYGCLPTTQGDAVKAMFPPRQSQADLPEDERREDADLDELDNDSLDALQAALGVTGSAFE